MGKFFCRICRVKGSDQNNASPSSAGPAPDGGDRSQDALGSEQSAAGSEAGDQPAHKKGRKTAESMEAMVQRVKRFFSVRTWSHSQYLSLLIVEPDLRTTEEGRDHYGTAAHV